MKHERIIDVFTDGSFHDTNELKDKTYGAIYIPSFEDSEWQFFTNNRTYVDSRNVGGEILAAEFAISLITRLFDAEQVPVHYDVNLYFDYEGVGKWLSGEWRAKKFLTQKYKEYVTGLLAPRDISLYPHHVRGHAGNGGNERADKLACEAYHSERCYDAASFIEEVLK